MGSKNKFINVPAKIGLMVLLTLGFIPNGYSQIPSKKKKDHHENHPMQDDAFGYADSINQGLILEDTMNSSPRRQAMKTIGSCHVHIEYSSPGVKGRVIWGGLVAYGRPWVTGAHMATRLQINRPIKINNKIIPAGNYALFTIPGETEWKFIINRNYKQHLTDKYKQKLDILRIPIVPKENVMTPRLTYTVEKTGEQAGVITMAWERLIITIPFMISR